MDGRTGFWLAIVAALIVLAGILIATLPGDQNGMTDGENGTTTPNMNGEIDTSTWETYTNEGFGFSIRHPESWQVHEAPEDPIEPKFNIYKPPAQAELPYTHHTQGATHVSVFPHGIPTEGVFGESRESTVDFGAGAQQARDFILADGTVWATFANFPNASTDWNESGFVFAAVEVGNLETECRRDGEIIPEEQCDPLASDDQIIRRGSVSEEDRRIQELMLESLEFMQ